MGLFSLFGKREPEPKHSAPAKAMQKRAAIVGVPTKLSDAAGAQAKIRASSLTTALKIDAIESEMSSEFIHSARMHTIIPGAGLPPAGKRPAASSMAHPTMGASTAFLLGSETIARTVAMSASEAAPAVEEAAIMFSLGQLNVVEELLQGAVHDGMQDAWAMLFDLYEVTHQHALFDELSIAYAEQFETSPPGWHEVPLAAPPAGSSVIVPSYVCASILDRSIAPELARVQTQARNAGGIRLDFSQVASVDPLGCELLLRILKNLQKSATDLVLAGAPRLIQKIRDTLKVGRRDENAAPWLLLLEIYRLLHLEQEFEDCSMDYCVTFEVSPPAYSLPRNKVTLAQAATAEKDPARDDFIMPPVIADHCEPLLQEIGAYAASHNPAIFDCSHLIRIDFNAASLLMAQLQPLVAQGRVIEFNEVNHLVQALLKVIGLQDLILLHLRRN